MSRRVLLVEHDPDLSQIYSEVMEKSGFVIKRSRGAQHSITLLDEWEADVIVLDLGLPGNSGIEVLHELQSYDDWSSIPVIALTNVRPEHYPLDDADWADYGVHTVLYRPTIRPADLVSLVLGIKGS